MGEGQANYGSPAIGPIECRIKSEDGVEVIFKGQDFLDSVFVYCLVFLKAIWIAVIGTLLLFSMIFFRWLYNFAMNTTVGI